MCFREHTHLFDPNIKKMIDISNIMARRCGIYAPYAHHNFYGGTQ